MAKLSAIVSDITPVKSRKSSKPLVRFTFTWGILGEEGFEPITESTRGCLAFFAPGGEFCWTYPMTRMGFQTATMTELSPRLYKLGVEALQRAGCERTLKGVYDTYTLATNNANPFKDAEGQVVEKL